MEFRWNQWNIEHIAEHGLNSDAAEYVVENAIAPWPRKEGDDKYRVWGQTAFGDYVQVIFVFDPPGVVYVIHARPLSDSEKRKFRRSKR